MEKRNKKEVKKREVKKRVHIYLTEKSLKLIDSKARKFGLDRSPFIQLILNLASLQLTMPNNNKKLKQ